MDEKRDFGATTAVNLVWEKAKGKLTPRIVWGAIAALSIGIGYVVNAQHDISHLKETVIRLEAGRNVAAEERDQDREVLHKIDKAVDVLNDKVDNIGTEVRRQQGRWDRVEQEADSPPHARRRK